MKTLVTAAHHPGPAENGADGCHARASHDGRCPGVDIASWLNGLGDDVEPYAGLTDTSNGTVRDRWIAGSQHIVPINASMAQLDAEQRRLVGSLRKVRLAIKRLKAEQQALEAGRPS